MGPRPSPASGTRCQKSPPQPWPYNCAQIHKRGRDYENTISIDYLSRLNERYEAWITKYDKGNLLIIDVDDLDFVSNPEDLGGIISKIDAQINGLF